MSVRLRRGTGGTMNLELVLSTIAVGEFDGRSKYNMTAQLEFLCERMYQPEYLVSNR